MSKLPIDFYSKSDVVQIAKQLIGKVLITNFDGKRTGGRIVETEAYAGITDKASHSYKGRRTARNEHMYAQPGTAYVYICYGIHPMFNIVTNEQGIPDAVLIRALEPMDGIEIMLERTRKKMPDNTVTRGPGNLARALGITKSHSGINLTGEEIFIIECDQENDDLTIGTSKRIGVDYAEEDALLPYRFFERGNKFVSGKPKE